MSAVNQSLEYAKYREIYQNLSTYPKDDLQHTIREIYPIKLELLKNINHGPVTKIRKLVKLDLYRHQSLINMGNIH